MVNDTVLSHDFSTDLFFSKITNNCFDLSEEECIQYIEQLKLEGSDSIFTQFKQGDRLYGFNGGTTPYIMVFFNANLFDPYNLIIDPIYNLFLKQEHNVLGIPEFNPEAFVESCRKYHEFYLSDNKLTPLLKEDLSERSKFADACIRMCKLGLIQTLLQGNRIYFVLDGLNMNDIVAKKDKTSTNVPIGYYTNKELRYCYRLSKTAPELAENISFWENGKRVSPPWVTNSEQWKDYKPKMKDIKDSLKNLKSSNPSFAETRSAFFSSDTAAQQTLPSSLEPSFKC